jgi:hypothetical protein
MAKSVAVQLTTLLAAALVSACVDPAHDVWAVNQSSASIIVRVHDATNHYTVAKRIPAGQSALVLDLPGSGSGSVDLLRDNCEAWLSKPIEDDHVGVIVTSTATASIVYQPAGDRTLSVDSDALEIVAGCP